MKKYLLLLLFVCFAALVRGQAADTPKDPPLPMNGLDADAPADNSPVFSVVDEMPVFPGGIDSLKHYLSKHAIYPAEALQKHLGGMVKINAVVEKDGRLTGFRIISTTADVLSAEAIRVLQPVIFIPGKIHGQPVRVMQAISVRFDAKNPAKFSVLL